MITQNTGIVPFNEMEIPYVFVGEIYWIAVNFVAENIGLNANSAVRSLQNGDFLGVHTLIRRMNKRDILCIDLDFLAVWLSRIQISKVREDVKPILLRYQHECAKVLKEHFFGKAKKHNEGKLAYQAIQELKTAIKEMKSKIELSPEGLELKALNGELKKQQIALSKLVDEQFGGDQLQLGM